MGAASGDDSMASEVSAEQKRLYEELYGFDKAWPVAYAAIGAGCIAASLVAWLAGRRARGVPGTVK